MTSSRSRAVGGLLLCIASLGTSGCGDGDAPEADTGPIPAGLEKIYRQPVKWSRCADKVACAHIQVPLDYAHPDDDPIEIAVSVRKATSKKRLGALLLNFGGPGAPATPVIANAMASALFKTLNESYDLVGFDPRATGDSEPKLLCYDAQSLAAFDQLDITPDDDAEIKALQDALDATASKCEQTSGQFLPFVGSTQVVQDIDVIRALLGEKKLNWLGFSYGTGLGAAYAHRFPANVGRVVLDGTVDPALSSVDENLQQAKGVDRTLRLFAEACVKQGCAAGDSADAVEASISKLLKDLDAKPIQVPGKVPLSEHIALEAIGGALYDTDDWDDLDKALGAALKGDGAPLLAMSDVGDPVDERITFESASTAIDCTDTSGRLGVDDVQRALPSFERDAPLFGRANAWSLLSCGTWPTLGDDSWRDVRATDAPPLLLLGSTGDPATPIEWTDKLRDELGAGVRLIRVGAGHTAYTSGNRCIDTLVDDFFALGGLPMDGFMCEEE